MVRPIGALPTRDPPQFPDEYLNWLKNIHAVETDKLPNHYQAVSSIIRQTLLDSPFWCELRSKFHDLNDAYKIKCKYPLFAHYDVDVIVKPYDSFLLKTYRKNVSLNKNWFNEPDSGWVLPPDWYSKINDIVRTTLVVKYLDGIQFLLDEMNNIASRFEVIMHHTLEARSEGYYAAHVYFSLPVEIPKIDWDTETREITFEIQITTQLKDVIKSLLHEHYENKRMVLEGKSSDWQWNYKSKEFSTNYLGHMLH